MAEHFTGMLRSQMYNLTHKVTNQGLKKCQPKEIKQFLLHNALLYNHLFTRRQMDVGFLFIPQCYSNVSLSYLNTFSKAIEKIMNGITSLPW